MAGLFLGIDIGKRSGIRIGRPARIAAATGSLGTTLVIKLPAIQPIFAISIGGGGNNRAWVAIRRRILSVPVTVAKQTEASYGAALLALHGGPP